MDEGWDVPHRLVVIDGPATHAAWDIPIGETAVGRDNPLGLVTDGTVSRRHVLVSRHGDQVALRDLGSTNGTWVNHDRLRGETRPLHPGDTVRLGDVRLRYDSPARRPQAQPMRFGDVHGPVNTGPGRQYVAGRDQHIGDRFTYTNDYDASDEMFQGRGFGRFLMIFGWLLSLGGFALIGYFFMVAFGSSIDDPVGRDPMAVELVPGVPVLPVGAAAFLFGAVLAGIGSGMSKAARKRAERRGNA
ncbi:FHA domain-containing protein [Actinoplanes sp. LDG1-06]|uniref:FHA domain-containing protein n=1 Tax=Paractinoplanes ovalisporus TaxID=2810368 RepID=A0ABS2AFC4_9ACTN|nr:FHA domain-containing protein [Actinoplanes ovalisporus]MBM2618525.1 FHA domain-containing protein [Actinoplanes ovalisporus]